MITGDLLVLSTSSAVRSEPCERSGMILSAFSRSTPSETYPGEPGPLLFDGAAAPGIVVVVRDLLNAQTKRMEHVETPELLADRLAALELEEDRRSPRLEGVVDLAAACCEERTRNVPPASSSRRVAVIDRAHASNER